MDGIPPGDGKAGKGPEQKKGSLDPTEGRVASVLSLAGGRGGPKDQLVQGSPILAALGPAVTGPKT